MSDAEIIALVKQRGGKVGPSIGELMAMREAQASCRLDGETYTLDELPTAKARSHTPGRMNKLETRYSAHLDTLKAAGEITWWYFEAVKLRLAKKTFYTPDFLVIKNDGAIEFHETKGGFIRDDAMVKIKVAAEMFPIFRFMLVKKTKGGWWVTPVNQR